jgi:hypothetical protein
VVSGKHEKRMGRIGRAIALTGAAQTMLDLDAVAAGPKPDDRALGVGHIRGT